MHFSFKSRSNIFKEMISWIANINLRNWLILKHLMLLRGLEGRGHFFLTAMISFKRRVLYKEIGNAQIFKAKIHGTFLL